VALPALPRIDRLELAELVLPEWHPRAADGSCAVLGYVVHHPDGPVVFDTGVGRGNGLIDELYQPTVHDLVGRLAAVGVDERDVVAVVNSHLHFDHCGQNAALAAPVHVQAAERAVAAEPGYTVPAWAALPDERWRVVDGDAELADGLRVVATPGHTPGHQSVVVSGGDEVVVLGGQCSYTAAEFEAGTVAEGDAHDGSWHPAAVDSLRRLRGLRPTRALLAHDRVEWTPGP
jgi:glyoxylase-like metal-dependent hydrolase (beta-lactamase superfamily II)